MIRLEFALRRAPGMSRQDFQRYWRDVHGPLVARHSTTLAIHRYIQLHTLDDPINDALAAARGGMEPAYDGVAELWWTSPEAFKAFGTPAGQAAAMELLEDEKNFIDLPNSPLWFAYEYPQVNPHPYLKVPCSTTSALGVLIVNARLLGRLPLIIRSVQTSPDEPTSERFSRAVVVPSL